MDYEKKYKEALEIVKAYYNRTQFSSIINSQEEKETLEHAFPELAESEDEWIRKHIIKILDNLAPCHWDGNEKARCIAYLEKQKESELLNNDEYHTVKVEILDRLYAHEKELEQLKKEQEPAEWSKEDEGMLNCIIATLCEESHGGREVNDKMVAWLENRLKILRPQSKQEWGEEDERNLTDAISAIEHLKNDCDWGYLGVGNDIDNVLNFLGSLPQRFNLQPK